MSFKRFIVFMLLISLGYCLPMALIQPSLWMETAIGLMFFDFIMAIGLFISTFRIEKR